MYIYLLSKQRNQKPLTKCLNKPTHTCIYIGRLIAIESSWQFGWILAIIYASCPRDDFVFERFSMLAKYTHTHKQIQMRQAFWPTFDTHILLFLHVLFELNNIDAEIKLI